MKRLNILWDGNKGWGKYRPGLLMGKEIEKYRKQNREFNLMRKGRIGSPVLEYKIDIEEYKRSGKIIKIT